MLNIIILEMLKHARRTTASINRNRKQDDNTRWERFEKDQNRLTGALNALYGMPFSGRTSEDTERLDRIRKNLLNRVNNFFYSSI